MRNQPVEECISFNKILVDAEILTEIIILHFLHDVGFVTMYGAAVSATRIIIKEMEMLRDSYNERIYSTKLKFGLRNFLYILLFSPRTVRICLRLSFNMSVMNE